jgi:hypothetical protein
MLGRAGSLGAGKADQRPMGLKQQIKKKSNLLKILIILSQYSFTNIFKVFFSYNVIHIMRNDDCLLIFFLHNLNRISVESKRVV